jgi:hypothetical protein
MKCVGFMQSALYFTTSTLVQWFGMWVLESGRPRFGVLSGTHMTLGELHYLFEHVY